MNSKCIICSSQTTYFFSKTFDISLVPFEKPLCVDYYRCENCGFVLSKTHSEMNSHDWEKLNIEWHTKFDSWDLDLDLHLSNRPPFIEQALVISILSKYGLLDLNNALDFAAGYANLAGLLDKYFGIKVNVFDRYIQDNGNGINYLSENDLGNHSVVINTAMFEHVLNRDLLEEVNSLVADNGVLMIHTVICENVPKDPNWFYLLPVHTAFHTNRSMSILMQQWGYKSSIYSPQAKCWFLFKKLEQGEAIVKQINQELQTKWFYYKEGFVDYWKGY